MRIWRNAALRAYVIQALLLAAVAAVAVLIIQSTITNLRARGIPLGLDFLLLPGGFRLSETIISLQPGDPYWWAAIVGIANTLYLSIIVAVLSSILGLAVGIGRLSSNPLVAATCRLWVEIARNTPAIILLILLYSLWWQILPQVTEAYRLAPGAYLSIRGLVLPRLSLGLPWLAFLAVPVAVAILVAAAGLARAKREATGRQPHYLAVTMAVVTLAGGTALWTAELVPQVDWPQMGRANFEGGVELTPELTTILIGLTFYTTGFVAEIVRGGILAIGKGQWEAGRALGLSRWQILRLVIIPQTLRVIMPPLTSQYINIVKNSTLAIAVGYPDFMTVMGTVINKSSHAIEGVAVIIGVFLIMNLGLSAILNWYNRRIALVER